MRRTLTAVATAGALVALTVPALADSTTTTRVDGDHFGRAGVNVVGVGCWDPSFVPNVLPAFRIVDDGRGQTGQRSVGWRPYGTDYSIGAQVHLDAPSQLEELSWRVRASEGPAVGYALVTYHPPDDDGTWLGTLPLRQDRSEDWQTVHAGDLVYSWHHYNADGVQDRAATAQDLPGFVAGRGGDGEGADVGFAYGCEGHAFLVDRIRVRADGDTRTWDFEGHRTRTRLTLSKRQVTYGDRVRLTTRLREAVGGAAKGGTVRLEARKAGSKRFRLVKELRTGVDGEHTVRFRPARNATYRAVHRGSLRYEGSRDAVRVKVRPLVRAQLRAATVRQGDRFTVTGRFTPGRRAKVSLQQYVDGRWRTRQAAQSGRDGRFSVGMVARRVGTSYWRIRVAGGGGNTWGRTPAMKLTTKAEPRPDDGGDPPPPEPPPPTEPPPPPPGPQRTTT